MATLQQTNPCPGGHEIYNFGRPVLGHYYFTLSLYEPSPGLENKILMKYINLHFLPPKYLPLGWREMKFAISCLLTIQILYTNFG